MPFALRSATDCMRQIWQSILGLRFTRCTPRQRMRQNGAPLLEVGFEWNSRCRAVQRVLTIGYCHTGQAAVLMHVLLTLNVIAP